MENTIKLSMSDASNIHNIVMAKMAIPRHKLHMDVAKKCNSKDDYARAKLFYEGALETIESCKEGLCNWYPHYNKEDIDELTDYLVNHRSINIFKCVGKSIMDILAK